MKSRADKPSEPKRGGKLGRREFLAGAGSAAMSFTIMKPGLVRGSQANSKISLGVIGNGSRGTWIAGLFKDHGGYEITAGADYFADRANAFGDKFNLSAARRFTGLKGYQRLIEAKVDAVAVESPPYFHREQGAAALEAGVHVYLAKPMAVDVPGCRNIEADGKRAETKKLAYLIDFQTRTDPFYQEAIRRVQKEGAIGRILGGEVSYVASSPWPKMIPELAVNPQDPERRLRAWGLIRALSGDIITEQNIHSIDVMTWILDQHPVKALGTGGLISRNIGDIWDHFAVNFWYPNDVLMVFFSKQYGAGADDIRCEMWGADGTIDAHYAGEVTIKGKTPYAGGRDGMMYTTGAVRNIAWFHEQLTSGKFDYSTVAPAVRSNLTTLLGRMAAYKGTEVTWDELMRSEECLDPHLEGAKD